MLGILEVRQIVSRRRLFSHIICKPATCVALSMVAMDEQQLRKKWSAWQALKKRRQSERIPLTEFHKFVARHALPYSTPKAFRKGVERASRKARVQKVLKEEQKKNTRSSLPRSHDQIVYGYIGKGKC